MLPGPRSAPQADPDKGTAPDACRYASADGTALLTLTPGTRPYETELAAAHDLSRDPSSAGMRDVRVTRITGLGQAASSERGDPPQHRRHVTYVVWREGPRARVLTLAEVGDAGKTQGAGRLVPLAKRIRPWLSP